MIMLIGYKKNCCRIDKVCPEEEGDAVFRIQNDSTDNSNHV